jgi:hypothetical protein
MYICVDKADYHGKNSRKTKTNSTVKRSTNF